MVTPPQANGAVFGSHRVVQHWKFLRSVTAIGCTVFLITLLISKLGTWELSLVESYYRDTY